jgi:hypothetical protein
MPYAIPSSTGEAATSPIARLTAASTHSSPQADAEPTLLGGENHGQRVADPILDAGAVARSDGEQDRRSAGRSRSQRSASWLGFVECVRILSMHWSHIARGPR